MIHWQNIAKALNDKKCKVASCAISGFKVVIEKLQHEHQLFF